MSIVKRNKNGTKKSFLPICFAFVGVIIGSIAVFMIFYKQKAPQNEISKTQQETVTEPVRVTENGISYRYEITEGYMAMIPENDKKVLKEDLLSQARLSIAQGKAITLKGNDKLGYSEVAFYLNPLFSDEHLVHMEYLLENCVGTVNGDWTYPIGTDYQIKSKPYQITPDKQEEIYLCIYVKFENNNSSIADKTKVVNKTLEQARLKVKLTYDDNREEIRYIGFKPYNEFNYNQYHVYYLTLEEQ